MHLLRERLGRLFVRGLDNERRETASVPHLADLYRRFGPAVFRRALSLLNNPEEAMDVTQDAFVALVQQLDKVKGESEAFSLVYQIATNQAIDRVRRNRRWAGKPAPHGEDEAPQDAPCEGGVRRIEAALELALLTRGESPRALTAALLHFVEGCTVAEVGEALELSPKTAGRLLERFTARARKRSVRFEGERK